MADEATTLLGGTPPAADPAKEPEKTAVDPAAVDPAKTAVDPAKEPAKEPEKAAEKPVVPEKYEDFKVPEGYTLDPAAVAEVAPLFKELGLSQEKAQKLIDAQTKINQKAAEDATKAWNDLRAGWVSEAKADKEIGGDKFDQNVALAKKAMEKLGTPKLAEALNQTGMGDHPELIRFMVKLGGLVADDKLHFGSASGATPKTAAEIMYGSAS